MASRLVGLTILASCASAPDHDPADFDPVDWNDSKSDASGVPAFFDRNTIMTDYMFTATGAVTGDAVQQFLEDNPYGTRSWLADATVGGARFSDAVVEVGQQYGIDPIVFLARIQVESSLVSATVRPSSTRLNTALGCGCPSSYSCAGAYAGLAKQLDCAGEVLATHFADSAAGDGSWVEYDARSTLDHYRIVPTDNATAALYAYTPWVLVGRGGNWLVWNVTRKYLKHFDDQGTLQLP